MKSYLSYVVIVELTWWVIHQDMQLQKVHTSPGSIVTNAKPGSSLHNFGLVPDFCPILDGKEISWNTDKDFDGDKKADRMEVVAIFKAHGWTWGGNFKSITDKPHAEKTFSKTW